jgi:hypothetical protein
MENPNSATAVISTLAAVTFSVPKLFVNLSLCRLETIVPAAIIIEIPPA